MLTSNCLLHSSGLTVRSDRFTNYSCIVDDRIEFGGGSGLVKAQSARYCHIKDDRRDSAGVQPR